MSEFTYRLALFRGVPVKKTTLYLSPWFHIFCQTSHFNNAEKYENFIYQLRMAKGRRRVAEVPHKNSKARLLTVLDVIVHCAEAWGNNSSVHFISPQQWFTWTDEDRRGGDGMLDTGQVEQQLLPRQSHAPRLATGDWCWAGRYMLPLRESILWYSLVVKFPWVTCLEIIVAQNCQTCWLGKLVVVDHSERWIARAR